MLSSRILMSSGLREFTDHQEDQWDMKMEVFENIIACNLRK